MREQNFYSVTEINNYIRSLIREDLVSEGVGVTGELSGVKYHSSGHIYFTLKDKGSSLKCIMFASDAHTLKFRLRDGQKVNVTGRIDVYVAGGTYQLYATKISSDGEGDLYKKFLELKEKLESEGLFDPMYKMQLPPYVKRLGVVTAPTGAAVRDIINVAKRRNPYIDIVLFPALVQGEDAPESVIKGIKLLPAHGVDCMIVGRGGGSMEDLQAFNSEAVVRAVFDCPVPVISAVGHETDFTLCDFVADLRAPTPSAAAELAVFDYELFEDELFSLEDSLITGMNGLLDTYLFRLENYLKELNYLGPKSRLNQLYLQLDSCTDRLTAQMRASLVFYLNKMSPYRNGLLGAMSAVTEKYKNKAVLYEEKLKGLSPSGRLKDGYGYLTDGKGKRIKSARDINVGDGIKIYLSDGRADTDVKAVTLKDYGTFNE